MSRPPPASISSPTSEFTSQVGSYRCTSNHDRSVHHKKEKSERDVKPTTLIVMRHSERIDDLFPGWIEKTNVGGVYTPYDLNMPTRLCVERPIRDFFNDTPLTRSGMILAQMIGRALHVTSNAPDIIYCSPSLRCLQTATFVREMSDSKALLRVEPGLFENCTLYPKACPVFLTPLQRLVFPVDKSYRSIFRQEELFKRVESVEQYNDRLKTTLDTLAEHSEIWPSGKKLTVLVVAHASTVDMSVGLLRERPRRSAEKELCGISVPVPYCAIVYLEKGKSGWTPNPYVIPPITYEGYTNQYNEQFVNRP